MQFIHFVYYRRRSGESSFTDKLATKSENSGVVPLKDIADGKSAGSCKEFHKIIMTVDSVVIMCVCVRIV